MFDNEGIGYKFISTSQHFGIIEDNRKRLKVRKPDMYLSSKKEDLRNIWDVFKWAPEVLWNSRKLRIRRKDWVIIHGDTESTFLSLIIAKFFRARTVHVEAGPRSHNWLEPFPEELIRAITDNLCDIDFCPHQYDADNIKKKKGKYVTNGNTIFDSVRMALKEKPSENVMRLSKTNFVLFLVHRKENVFVTERLNSIVDILEEILKRGFKVVWTMHTNTQHELKEKGIWDKISKLKERYDLELSYFFDYVDFMHAVKYSQFVASDGGGLQDETYLLDKPMLVLRKVLEKKPGDGQTAYLSYLDINKVKTFLDKYKTFKAKSKPEGSPTKLIVEFFKNNL